ncbi:MAG: hypothetical protein A3I11_02190 [Elusimicrobia bacterium RIFCSPLOWO2_02_FULL_39_32]|nr:MAG: hypothetical protein A2034_01065 [Elusimicrobia bacterium GWA2_38_7]OGR78429.1 MAG: hypothetical protein A3B80_07075 [Elusimicrobia bacterium RIFCSPHIGHO2_02_FULL_39_36]OGR92188.1 MAG: hypothetical protein A3I11_02190 [Elusimicrobia bacterium RIFCSPLOWO2_02_FULL_39_32]OGR99944.1 MAG: hypothetical protein A3G85_03245 [Elusimicrobia bacterium RIFCSPLOWO2_12_FULL_39_28]
MRILFLSHTFPLPIDDGVRLQCYYLLKELAKSHSIYLLCLNDSAVSNDAKEKIRSLGIRLVDVIEHPVPRSFWQRLANSLFDPVPFCVRQFESKLLRKTLKNFLSNTPIDVVHVNYLSMSIYRDEFPLIPSIFFPLDAVSMMFERNIRFETNIFRKFYMYLQWKKVINFESKILLKFEENMVVSPVDKDHLLKRCPKAKIEVSPLGLNTDYFIPKQNVLEESDSILFRGVMNFFPNTDAVRYFYKTIFPMVRKQSPSAKFYVVGKSPSSDILAWAKEDSGLTLTGFVDDIRIWMARASVVVCPMRVGSGIKIKIMESMSMGKAIVSTSLACAGLEVKNEEHLLIEDDPFLFAQKIVYLLKDRQARIKLGNKARKFVLESYSWSKNTADFEKLYKRAFLR